MNRGGVRDLVAHHAELRHRGEFLLALRKDLLELNIPKIGTISSGTRLSGGASKTILVLSAPKSPRFLEFGQQSARLGLVASALPPARPELLDSRDFAGGDGFA